jgi:hypothetical protein
MPPTPFLPHPKRGRKPVYAPYLTTEPWVGYTSDDYPRETPQRICPKPRCRRAKQCIAAHDDLYCLRTHFTPKEYRQKHNLPDSAALVPRVRPSSDYLNWDSIYDALDRCDEKLDTLKEYTAEQTDRWKAGLFDHLYGPYKPRGVMKHPPPRVYVEEGSEGAPPHSAVIPAAVIPAAVIPVGAGTQTVSKRARPKSGSRLAQG